MQSDRRNWLTCGKMAQVNGTTDKALRLYHKKGLLIPQHIDKSTGYRYYDILQSTRLDMITQLQDMGFSLDAIKELSSSKSVERLRHEADQQRALIQEKQRQLALAEHAALDLVECCDLFLNMGACDVPIIENLPERSIITFDLSQDESLETGANNRSDSDQWELAMSTVKSIIAERGWPSFLMRRGGFLADPQRLDDSEMWREKIFFFVDSSFGDCFQEGAPLPGGTHVVLYTHEGYDSEGGAVDQKHLQKIVDHASSLGFAPAGDAFCEGICRFPRFFNQSFESFSRFCLPVKPAENA